MERKKNRIISLKFRILRAIFVVLTISMLLSTVISYVYFVRIAGEERIGEAETGLQQISNQLHFMFVDIQNFARSIIVDGEIMETVENIKPADGIGEMRKRDIVSKRLVFYNSLRTYIRNSFMEVSNGEFYSSSVILQPEYKDDKLSIGGIREYRRHTDWVFSNPYHGIDNWDYQPMICYSTRMMDIYFFGRQRAVLTLEINLEYFLHQVRNYSDEYTNLCLVGNDGFILYEAGGEKLVSRLLKNHPEYLSPGIHRVAGGYLISKAIDGTGWELCTLVTERFLWRSSSYVFNFFLLSFLVSMFGILLTASQMTDRITRPLTFLSRHMRITDYEKLHVLEAVRTGDEIQILYECYNAMVGELQRGIAQKMEYEKQKSGMEFDIILSQINPHYLYNVLNTVVYLSAAGKNKEVVSIVNALIYTLQETINLGDADIETTVRRELELTEYYLVIQRYRYPRMFNLTVTCAEEEKDCIVPKTIIQPIVENALLHGILPSERAGNIGLDIARRGERLSITVTDDGVGMSAEGLRRFRAGEAITDEENSRSENGRKHIGISNVRDRIRYLYGEPYGLWITNRPAGGTGVEIVLPYAIGKAKQ